MQFRSLESSHPETGASASHSLLPGAAFASIPCTTRSQLNAAEIAQLGTPCRSARYVNPEEWMLVRERLVARDMRRNPQLDPELTAYTPGETLRLLDNPTVQTWHERMGRFRIPKDVDLVILVPCAATKPWSNASRGIYCSYNRLRELSGKKGFPRLYFVTVSEPLGVVPEKHWGDFPQYENPGLFRDPVQRSGMFTAEWKKLFGERLIIPFDEGAYGHSIDRLAAVIKSFLERNRQFSGRILSFVDNLPGQSLSTHSDMLRRADPEGTYLQHELRFTKRAQTRQPPFEHLKRSINEHCKRAK